MYTGVLLSLLAAAVPPALVSPQVSGLLRWRSIAVERDGDSRTFALPGPGVVRLRGRFGSGCEPAVVREFGGVERSLTMPLPLSRQGAERLLVIPPAITPGLGDAEVEPPASYRVDLPPRCGDLQAFQAAFDRDELALLRARRDLLHALGSPPRADELARWLAGPHPHVWQETAALAIASRRLLGRLPGDDKGVAASALARLWLERALLDARADEPSFAFVTPIEPALPTRTPAESREPMYQARTERGVRIEVREQHAVRLFHRAVPDASDPSLVRWRMKVRFDDGPTRVMLAVAGRDPVDGGASTRERALALAVPPRARTLTITPVDRPLLVRGSAYRFKGSFAGALGGGSPDAALAEALAVAGRGQQGRLVAALARAEIGDASGLGRLEPIVRQDPLVAALVDLRWAELSMDRARAEELVGQAEALARAAADDFERALAEVIGVRAARVCLAADVGRERYREAADRLAELAAKRALTGEDAALLSQLESMTGRDVGVASRSLAAMDALLAQRPLDRDLIVTRARGFALSSVWRGLAAEGQARDIGFLEPLASEDRWPQPVREGFVLLPRDGGEIAVDLPASPVPGRVPVMSFVATRGRGGASMVSVQMDGKPLVHLPVLASLERFEVPVPSGSHRIRLGERTFAGEIYANFAQAPRARAWRRYAVVERERPLRFFLREAGIPQAALVSLRVSVEPGTRPPAQIPVQLTGAGAGAKPIVLRLRPGAPAPDAQGELPSGWTSTVPVEATLPLAGTAGVLTLSAQMPQGVHVLAYVAVRARRGQIDPCPPDAEVRADAGDDRCWRPVHEGDDLPDDDHALLDALEQITDRMAKPDAAGRAALLIRRAEILARLDEIGSAREDLLSAVKLPGLQAAHRERITRSWLELDVAASGRSFLPRRGNALAPAIDLVREDPDPFGGGLPALADDLELLRTGTVDELRARAGEGKRDGDLAVLLAALDSERRGDWSRASVLWSNLVAAHPQRASVHGAAAAVLLRVGEPALVTRAYLEAWKAVELAPQDPETRRLLRRVAALTQLEPLRFFDESAGSLRIRMARSEPLDPVPEFALLPPAADAHRASLVTDERTATLQLTLGAPVRLVVRAATHEARSHQAEALRAPQIVLVCSVDGERPIRVPCPAGRACTSPNIAIPPGAHKVTARLEGGVRPVGRVWFDSDRAARTAPATVRYGAGQASRRIAVGYSVDYAVARADAPIRLTVRGRALLRLEVRRRSDSPVARTRIIARPVDAEPIASEVHLLSAMDDTASLEPTGAVSRPAVTSIVLDQPTLYRIEVRPERGEALVRMAIRTGQQRPVVAPPPPPLSFTALTPAPIGSPATLEAAPPLRLVDGDVAPGWDGLGTVSVGTGWMRRLTTPDGVSFQTDEAYTLGGSYRRTLDALALSLRLEGEVRLRAASASSQWVAAQLFYDDPDRRWLRLLVEASGTFQTVAGLGERRGRARLLYAPSFRLASGIYAISKVGLFGYSQSLAGVTEEQLEGLDPDLYSRYRERHPRALTLEQAVQAEPLMDLVLVASSRLTTNPTLTPADPESLVSSAGTRFLLGPLVVEAAMRHSWFFADGERVSPYARWTALGGLLYTFWVSERQNLTFAANAGRRFDLGSLDVLLSLSWGGSNGRRYRDVAAVDDEGYFDAQRGPAFWERARLEAVSP